MQLLRIPKIVLPFLIIGSTGCVPLNDNAQTNAALQISSKQLSDNVFVLYGGNGLGANVGVVVGDEGIVLIDSMNSKSSEHLRRAIEKISKKPVLFVINTHHHADHTGGNTAFTAGGAYTVAHEHSRYSPYMPQRMVSDGFTQQIGGEELIVHHIIGHTYNDLLVHLKSSNIIFMGDTFTNVWHPTANVRGLSSESSVVQTALSITDENTVIVPGHGKIDNRKGLQQNLENNEAWYARIVELSEQRLDADSMASDPVLNKIRATFVEQRTPPEMSDGRFLRFIQRTLSADFVETVPMTADELHAFTGVYVSGRGENIEILAEGAELFARMEGAFYEQLIPVAHLSFHVRFGLTTSYDFELKMSGVPNALTRRSGEQEIQASKTQ